MKKRLFCFLLIACLLLAAAMPLASAKDTETGEIVIIGDTKCGDVDNNGFVENTDRTKLARYLAEWGGEYDKINLEAADVDGVNGVENTDRTILSRYLAEWHGEYDAYFK